MKPLDEAVAAWDRSDALLLEGCERFRVEYGRDPQTWDDSLMLLTEDEQREYRRMPCGGCCMDVLEGCEHYMLHDDLWDRVAADGSRFLCVGCVEKRLGRRLTLADFTDCLLNTDSRGKSERLLDRLRGDDRSDG